MAWLVPVSSRHHSRYLERAWLEPCRQDSYFVHAPHGRHDSPLYQEARAILPANGSSRNRGDVYFSTKRLGTANGKTMPEGVMVCQAISPAREGLGVLQKTDLVIAKESPNCLDVYYEPSPDKVEEYGKLSDLTQTTFAYPEKLRKKLLRINGRDDSLTIFPLRTIPHYEDFLKPKYRQIESITLTCPPSLVQG
jgi:hypothetical protein